MAKKRKGNPFLEVLASALNEEYRFPILEIFAVIFVAGTLINSQSLVYVREELLSPEALVYSKIAPFMTLSLLQLVIVLKNIAYGLGSDLEHGTIQTYLSYPLKRRSFLTARLLSSVGVPVLLLLGIQMFTILIIALDTISSNPSLVALTIVAFLGHPLLLIGVAFVLALVFKKGRVALFGGVLSYFGILMFTVNLAYMGGVMGYDFLTKAFAVLMPFGAVSRYCMGGEGWIPSFTETLFYVGACYALVTLVFLLGYLYFEKRLET
jgi:ABC-type transport system involved in multi-copper enzyme maturation permease subunit